MDKCCTDHIYESYCNCCTGRCPKCPQYEHYFLVKFSDANGYEVAQDDLENKFSDGYIYDNYSGQWITPDEAGLVERDQEITNDLMVYLRSFTV
jgi:hypothetical protein